MNPLQTLGIAALVFALGSSSGWLVHGWQYDASQLASEQASEKAFHQAVKATNELSGKLQASIDGMEKNRLITTKEIIHETTKTEYRCLLPESGRLLYDAAAQESTITGKLKSSVPLR